MKFKVTYKKPKKKGFFSNQEAVFFDERDAINWEHYVKKLGYSDIETMVVLS